MRRTDRLFELVQILRDGKLHRAADLALAMGGVSPRTIWRDMATLMASGMPIESERGVGYVLRQPTMLPPLMLSAAEMAALREGLRAVTLGGDEMLARAARSLAAKIGALAPSPLPAMPDPMDGEDLFAFTRDAAKPADPVLPTLRAAMDARLPCQITLRDAADRPQQATALPLKIVTRDGQRLLVAQTGGGTGGDRLEIALERIVAVAPG